MPGHRLTWLYLALSGAGCSPSKDAPADRAASPDVTRSPGSATAAHPVSSWQIIPGRSAGPLTATSSEADLEKRYGTSAVKPVRIELGEGESTPGTVLFPGD